MINAVVYVAASTDGYIARPDGSLDWLEAASAAGSGQEADPPEDYGWADLMGSIDAVLLGRETFEVARSHPGAGEAYGATPVFVLSNRSLGETGDWRVERLAGDIDAVAATIAGRGLRTVYVDGGSVIQACLRAGLVRRITVTQIPVLLGGGISLFGGHDDDIPLVLESHRTYPNGWIQYTYSVGGPEV